MVPCSALARLFDDAGRLVELLDGRHQRGAVLERPAVILDVGDLHAGGVELDRQLDHLGELMEVLAMNDGVDGERQAGARDHAGDVELLLVGVLVAGDAVGDARVAVLEADLDVVEAGLRQRGELLRVSSTAEVMRLV